MESREDLKKNARVVSDTTNTVSNIVTDLDTGDTEVVREETLRPSSIKVDVFNRTESCEEGGFVGMRLFAKDNNDQGLVYALVEITSDNFDEYLPAPKRS